MEADVAEQGVAGDGFSTPQRHAGLQCQQLEDAGTGAEPSHHLWGWRWEHSQPWLHSPGGQQDPHRHLPAPAGWRCWPWTCGAQEERPSSGLSHGYAGCQGCWHARPFPDLCTVCEATKKDMRSPGESSSPAIKEPPTKMVPRTMPVGCRAKMGPEGVPAPWHRQVAPHGKHSPLSARLESPWKAAMPSPSRSFRQPARSTSAQYSLRAGMRLNPPAPTLPSQGRSPCHNLTLPAGPPWQRHAQSGHFPAPHLPPRLP